LIQATDRKDIIVSVLVNVLIEGDTDKFRDSLETRAEDYRRIGSQAKAAGVLHHRFAIGDGFVLVQDEWLTEQAFHEFFSNEELQAFIGEVGGDLSADPVVTIAEPVSSPDQF
jgi:hypothetical protein